MSLYSKHAAFVIVSICSAVANAQGNSTASWAYAHPIGASSLTTVVPQSSALTGISETTRLYYSVLNTALSLVPLGPKVTSSAEPLATFQNSQSLSSRISETMSIPPSPYAISNVGGMLSGYSTPLSTTRPVETTMAAVLPAVSILGSALKTFADPISSFPLISGTAADYTFLTSTQSTSPTGTVPGSAFEPSQPSTPSPTASISAPAAKSSSAGAAGSATITFTNPHLTTTNSPLSSSELSAGSLSYSSASVVDSVSSSFITRSASASQASSVSSNVEGSTSTPTAMASTGEARPSMTQTSAQAFPAGVKPAATTAAPPASKGAKVYPVPWLLAVLAILTGVMSD